MKQHATTEQALDERQNGRAKCDRLAHLVLLSHRVRVYHARHGVLLRLHRLDLGFPLLEEQIRRVFAVEFLENAGS